MNSEKVALGILDHGIEGLRDLLSTVVRAFNDEEVLKVLNNYTPKYAKFVKEGDIVAIWPDFGKLASHKVPLISRGNGTFLECQANDFSNCKILGFSDNQKIQDYEGFFGFENSKDQILTLYENSNGVFSEVWSFDLRLVNLISL